MSELTAFEDAFRAALEGDAVTLAPWIATDEDAPGLSVYRNTVVKVAVDALAATYATVERMVGEEWFRAAAATYMRQRPPRTPSLLTYGRSFPDWLASFPPAHDTPYLPDIARLDRLWWEAYLAPDAAPLASEAFAGLRPSDLAVTSARLHPSVRLAAFEQNAASLWLTHQPPERPPGEFQIVEETERMLIVRPLLEVSARLVDRASYAFLSACEAGESLLAAAKGALDADPDTAFPSIIANSLELGVFTRLEAAHRWTSEP